MKIERAKLGPCPVCGREIIENRKGYSCWSREDPGCGFVIWKKKARQEPAGVGRQGADREPAAVARARRGAARSGRTEKPVTGFRGRSGRSFRAKLKLEQREETGKWRVEFDEEWATMPAKEREEAAAAAEEAIAAKNGGGDGDAAPEIAEPERAAS